jgi:hypothetical protein
LSACPLNEPARATEPVTVPSPNFAIHKSAREKRLAVGRIANRRENGPVPLGHPRLVCQVAFVEWTDARHLRHSASSPCAMTRTLRSGS